MSLKGSGRGSEAGKDSNKGKGSGWLISPPWGKAVGHYTAKNNRGKEEAQLGQQEIGDGVCLCNADRPWSSADGIEPETSGA